MFAVLNNMPANVLVLHDSRVIFKNQHADNLMLSLCKEFEGFSDQKNFDLNLFFLNLQMFKAKLKSDESKTWQKIFKRLDVFSFLQIVENDNIIKLSERFQVCL